MALIFSPNGKLDISTDPMELPQELLDRGDTVSLLSMKKDIQSGAMVRCTNLHLDRPGLAVTRRGSDKLNAVAVDTNGSRIIESGGYRYLFSGAYIYQDEVEIDATRTAGTTWTATWYNPYTSTTEAIYAINGTDRVRVEGANVYEWGIDAPTVAATLAAGASTGLTGTYSVKYTYCRKEGAVVVSESNPSPVSSNQILANQSLAVTFTASGDAQVTHVRVYRTTNGGGVWYLDTDVAIGTVTLDTNVADDALGAAVPSNHDRPPLGGIVIGPAYNGQIFILKDNNLYYCTPGQPEYWPTDYYIEVSAAAFLLKAAAFLDGLLYVATKAEVYQIPGSGAASYFPLPLGAITGTQSTECFAAVKGQGIFHLGNDGVYLMSGGNDFKLPGFDPIWEGTTVGSIPYVNKTYLSRCWMRAWHNKLYFGYVGGTDTYPKNVIVWDLTNNRPTHYQYPMNCKYLARDRYNDRLLTCDAAGYVYKLEDVNDTTDDGTDIAWQIQTKDYSPFNFQFVRHARYDVTLGTGAMANGYILLDETIKQTHSLTTSRNNKRRLITGCTGNRLAMRMSGTGPITLYRMRVE